MDTPRLDPRLAEENVRVTAPPHKLPFQFGLSGLFRLMTVLASVAAICAWIKPYLAVGVDPPLVALPFLALAVGVFLLALPYSRQR